MMHELRQAWILFALVVVLIAVLGLPIWLHTGFVVAATVGHQGLLFALERRDKTRRRQLAAWNRRALP